MKRILWPILLVFLVQAGIFFGSIQVSGVISELQKNAFGTLTEKSSSRSSDLQNLMVQRWSNVGETLNRVLASTETVLDAAGKTPADITADGELTREAAGKIQQLHGVSAAPERRERRLHRAGRQRGGSGRGQPAAQAGAVFPGRRPVHRADRQLGSAG